MSKKIKKRSKKKDEEELLEAQGPAAEPKLEDYVDANDPAMEFGDPTTWENAGEDDIEVAPLPVDEDGEIDQAALEELTASDQLDLASARVADFVEKNLKLIAAALTIAAIAPIVFAIGKEVKQGMDVSSAEKISPAFEQYMRPVENSPELQFFEFNKDFAKPQTYASSQVKWETLDKQAAESLKSGPSTGVTATSKLIKAAAALRLEKWDDAISAYGELATKSPSKAIAPIVKLGLAQAYTGKGEHEKAVAAYDELAGLDKSYQPLAIYQKGLILEGAGQKDKAKETYHKLLEQFPETTFKADVERRLALL